MNVLNARMYAVTPAVAQLWRQLLERVSVLAGLDAEWLEHPAPALLEPLWQRPDLAAVFMCGLPYSRSAAPLLLVAAPVPSPPDYGSNACYWSEMVVAAGSTTRRIEDTFGARIAFTVAGSQSGYAAPLAWLQDLASTTELGREPLYSEVVGPVITPLGALQAVISGAAEVAPLDSYAFDLLRRHRPELTAQVRSIARTPATPNPVLVAAPQALSSRQLDTLRQTFQEAHGDPECLPLMNALLLQRFAVPAAAQYAALAERFERARRFWATRALATRIPPEFRVPGSQCA